MTDSQVKCLSRAAQRNPGRVWVRSQLAGACPLLSAAEHKTLNEHVIFKGAFISAGETLGVLSLDRTLYERVRRWLQAPESVRCLAGSQPLPCASAVNAWPHGDSCSAPLLTCLAPANFRTALVLLVRSSHDSHSTDG